MATSSTRNDNGYFKFTAAKYVDGLMNGRIRVSSLDFFRHMEERTGIRGIGDRTEGIVSYLGGITANAGSGDESSRRLRELGTPVDGDGTGTLQIQNISLLHPHCLVLCFSVGNYQKVRDAMCVSAPKPERYNAAIRIKDIDLLHEQLRHGTITVHGKPSQLATALGGAESGYGVVTYGNKETKLDGNEVLKNSALVKPKCYKRQSEARIVLMAPSSFRDRVDIKIADPGAVFEVVEPYMEDVEINGDALPYSVVIEERVVIAGKLDSLANEIDTWLRANVVRLRTEEIRPENYTERRATEYRRAEEDKRKRLTEEFKRRVVDLIWSAHLQADVCNVPFRERHRMLFPPFLFENISKHLREIAEIMRSPATW